MPDLPPAVDPDPFTAMSATIAYIAHLQLPIPLPDAVWDDIDDYWWRCLEARAELVAAKDGAYRERDELVALLSKLYPSHLSEHDPDDSDWNPAWRMIVCVHTPWGQAAWHVKWDTEYALFDHLDQDDVYSDWDGHTTEQKYDRLRQAAPAGVWRPFGRLDPTDPVDQAIVSTWNKVANETGEP